MMELGENPTLSEVVEPKGELKTFLINYVGQKQEPEDGNITVEMIIDTMSQEFPEFLMVFAEENWIRGYHQALIDVEDGEKLYKNNEANCMTDEEWVEGYKKCKTGKCGKCG